MVHVSLIFFTSFFIIHHLTRERPTDHYLPEEYAPDSVAREESLRKHHVDTMSQIVVKDEVAPQTQQQSSQPTKVEQCTAEQLATIKKQLPPDDCLKNKGQPWGQRCSHTYATRCPDAVWLEDFYTDIHKRRQTKDSFLGIFVGCNKGMDAVNAMRMGSGDATFDKDLWVEAMTQGGKRTLGNSVCAQTTTPQFALPDDTELEPPSFSQLHCIEPMPITADALTRSAQQLAWDDKGFVVTHAAISKTDGSIPFARGDKVGEENKGIGNCKDCVDVPMYSLNTYVSKFIPDESIPINYLSVDVEGFDMDVLLGGADHALPRVHYLEFEYNWMGSWKNQPLSANIEWLDEQGFTCYWAGFDNMIWRITKCFLDHYDVHFWSNVACVNRNVDDVRDVANSMERLFLETVARKDEVVMDYEHRWKGQNE